MQNTLENVTRNRQEPAARLSEAPQGEAPAQSGRAHATPAATRANRPQKRGGKHAGANGAAVGAGADGKHARHAVTPQAAGSEAHHELGKAGSDDASEFSVANAASCSSTAGTDRQACAAPAEPALEGRPCAARAASGTETTGADGSTGVAASSSRQGLCADDGETSSALNGETSSPLQPLTEAAQRKRAANSTPAANTENRFAAVPPGRKRLPVNGEAFVNAVHRQVDLVQLEVTLLRDDDVRIVQRELAYLRELRYGKRAPAEGDATQVIFRSTGREGDIG